MKRMWTKRRRGLSRFARGERGTQLVELAIVLPILLVLFGATAEFGRYFYTYVTLAKATRNGARYLATAAVKNSEDTRAKNLVIYGDPTGAGTPILAGLTPGQIKISRSGGVPVLPETVTVEIDGYVFQPLFDLGKLTGNEALSLNIEVRPSTTMRYLLTQPPA